MKTHIFVANADIYVLQCKNSYIYVSRHIQETSAVITLSNQQMRVCSEGTGFGTLKN